MICKLCQQNKDRYGRLTVCKECHKERVRKRYAENRTKELARMKNYAQENKETLRKAERKYYTENKNRWQAKKLKRKHLLLGTFTKQEWFLLNILCGFKCLCCGCFEPTTVDHIKPISCGGNNTIQNIQPLCHSCNSIKSTKTVDYRTIEVKKFFVQKY